MINWPKDGDVAILEGIALDRLDSAVPATIRIAVLTKDALQQKKEALTKLVNSFYQVLHIHSPDSQSHLQRGINNLR